MSVVDLDYVVDGHAGNVLRSLDGVDAVTLRSLAQALDVAGVPSARYLALPVWSLAAARAAARSRVRYPYCS